MELYNVMFECKGLPYEGTSPHSEEVLEMFVPDFQDIIWART